MALFYETYHKNFLAPIKEELRFTDSILDIGSGICQLLDDYESKIIVALDIHRPYLENRKTKQPHIIPLCADAKDIGKLFIPKTFSAVTFIDSLEHFDKNTGLKMLQTAEQIAKNKIVIFTPRDFFPQEGIDFYGFNGEKFQQHRSGWSVEEFLALGYGLTVFKNFHSVENPAFVRSFGPNHPPVDAILACKLVNN